MVFVALMHNVQSQITFQVAHVLTDTKATRSNRVVQLKSLHLSMILLATHALRRTFVAKMPNVV
jgi:hypothetical protein